MPERKSRLSQKNIEILLVLIAVLFMGYDLTVQELVREKITADELTLPPLLQFLHDNFAGDIINAFATVFFIPTVSKLVLTEDKPSPENPKLFDRLKEPFLKTLPWVMAIAFLGVALDAETTQRYFEYGTPDPLDLTGALYGTLTALLSYFRLTAQLYKPDGSET